MTWDPFFGQFFVALVPDHTPHQWLFDVGHVHPTKKSIYLGHVSHGPISDVITVKTPTILGDEFQHFPSDFQFHQKIGGPYIPMFRW